MLFVVILHLIGLHETGSTNVFGIHGGHEKVTFYPYY
jgi:quinol-cytochrome oxidoreductase complex cytochrome b subunit